MKKVVTFRKETFQDIGWNEFASIKEVKTLLGQKDWIGFDIETTGLSFMDSDIISYQFGGYGIDYIIDHETVPIKTFSSDIEKIGLVGQFLLFDIVFLYKHGIVPNKMWDTYLAEFNLTMGLLRIKRGLGDLISRYCGVEIDKSFQKEIAIKGILSTTAIKYAGDDTKYLIDIFNKQLEKATKYGVTVAIKLDSAFNRVLAYMEFCGIYINTKKWYKIIRRVEYEEYGAELKLNQFLSDNNVEVIKDFLWSSPKQVEQLFREKLGIDTFNSKHQKHTIQELHLIKQKHSIIKLYLTYKKKAKAVSTYGRNWLDFSFKDKRIHTKFNPIVRTGRTSCGQVKKGPFPNLQNIPAQLGMRQCFEGQGANRLVVCDYSQQEKIMLADKSKEPALLKFFKEGKGDLHSYTASLIFDSKMSDITLAKIKKDNMEILDTNDKTLLRYRQEAKAGGFAIDFGGNGYTIATNLNISVKKGEKVFNAYLNAFPKLRDYFTETSNKAKRRGYILVSRKTGRKRFIDSSSTSEQVYRLSLNSPIQGEAAEISKLAGIFILNEIIKNKRFGKTKIVNFIHDEWVVEDHVFKIEATAIMVQECMLKAGKYFLEDLILAAVPVINKSWEK